MDYSTNYPQKLDALSTMEIALAGLSNRTKALSNNIANINTPGYQKQKVEFETELKKLITDPENSSRLSDIPLELTHKKHLSNSVYEITELVTNSSSEIKSENNFSNENSINIDVEMTELAKTGMRYKGIANMTKRYFDNMKSIIRGS